MENIQAAGIQEIAWDVCALADAQRHIKSRPIVLAEDMKMSDPHDMWRCQTVNCGYVYDPDRGDRKHKIPAGTKFEDLPDSWRCPVCGAGKQAFRRLDEEL